MRKVKIVYYEGLMSYNNFFGLFGAYVQRYLISKLKGNVEVVGRPWTSDESVEGFDIVIGHSFGAYKAFEKAKRGQVLITMDMRGWWVLNPKKNHDLYFETKPGVMHFNFYQKKPLKGYMVLGARNLHLKGVSHGSLPSHPVIIKQLNELIMAAQRRV